MKIKIKKGDPNGRKKQNSTFRVVTIATLLFTGIFTASFLANGSLSSVDVIYLKIDEQKDTLQLRQMVHSIFWDDALAFEGNGSITQNQSDRAINQTSDMNTVQNKNSINGSIVTLPPLLQQLEDRRH